MIRITDCTTFSQKLTFDPFTSQMNTQRRNRTDLGQTEGSPSAEPQKRQEEGAPGSGTAKNPSQKAKFASALRRREQESETESELANDDLVTDEDQEGHSPPFHSHTSRVLHMSAHLLPALHMSTEPESDLELDTYASK